MAQLKIKGLFTEIFETVTVGEKNTRIQRAYFMVPGYHDSFGDKKGKDEVWEVSVIGDNIEKFNLITKAPATPKAELSLYINSREWFKTEDVKKEQPQYSLYAVVANVEFVA